MIAILLSTYNGSRFLPEQLESLERQSDTAWRVVWRDDGSTDNTRTIMAEFTARIGVERCRETAGSGAHLGAAQSFLSLLPEAADADAVAFADQDDVWLPDKLARARETLQAAGNQAMLYCARQYLVDEHLLGHNLSILPGDKPGFPASLTQNIVHGNTMVMNRAAADLVARIPGPPGTVHDWWSYIVITACGGVVVIDPKPVVLYRQHRENLIGSPPSTVARAIAAVRRGPGIFMTMMRRHVGQLAAHAEFLTEQARGDVTRISEGLCGGIAPRSRALRCPGLKRQTELENMLFRLWFMIG
jgi:glycosyltransferase involved in cell wall biosynthesis